MAEFYDLTLGVLLSGIVTGALISGVLAVLQRKEEERKTGLQQFANIFPQYFDENIKKNRLNSRVIVSSWRKDREGTIAVCAAWFLGSGTEQEMQEMMDKCGLTDEHMRSLESLLHYWTFISKYSKARGVDEKMMKDSLSWMLAWFSPFFSEFCCHMARTDAKGQLWEYFQEAKNTKGKEVIKGPWVNEIPDLIKRWGLPDFCED